jgi:hypothetical protein
MTIHITSGVEIFIFTLLIIPGVLFWSGIIFFIGMLGRTALRIWRDDFRMRMRIREWLEKEYGGGK